MVGDILVPVPDDRLIGDQWLSWMCVKLQEVGSVDSVVILCFSISPAKGLGQNGLVRVGLRPRKFERICMCTQHY